MPKGTGISDALLGQVCDVFKLLSDRTRLSILLYLAKEEHNVGRLCDKLGLPQPTVSHHLALMRMSRLIQKRRRGKQMIYSVSPETLSDLAAQMLKGLAGGKPVTVGGFKIARKA